MNLHCRVNNDDLENQITFDPKRYLVSQEMGNRLKIRWFSMSRRCPAIFFETERLQKMFWLGGTLKMSLSKWTSSVIYTRGFQYVSNHPIDEIYCTYTHKNWKNGLEFQSFKYLGRAQVFRKFNFYMIWIFPLRNISSVIGQRHKKMYYCMSKWSAYLLFRNVIFTELQSNEYYVCTMHLLKMRRFRITIPLQCKMLVYILYKA